MGRIFYSFYEQVAEPAAQFGRMSPAPVIHILLATYQGERYLAEQLDSIARQSYSHWTLTVSDDGSTDGTLQLVRAFQARVHQAVGVVSGPCLGATRNFLHLVRQKADAVPADLFAYCDQDDVWLPEKLARAVVHFGTTELATGTPYLYCSRTAFVDENREPLGLSRIPGRALSFGNALVENIASGNTMVFNQPLLKILLHIRPENAVWHDWSTYQAATACGGLVHFDGEVSLEYRQHRMNVFGARSGIHAKLSRVRYVLDGKYRAWGDVTERAMGDLAAHLPEASRQTLRRYVRARHEPSRFRRTLLIANSGVTRQSVRDQFALLVSFFFDLA